ncbi:MAG: pseudouridine-5'-phosphate glycosidase [Pisciglobus halotolerans]|nr:pseudouridine-5'-phosphate glycosidase [Atopostipes sp.]MDN6626897.1 pseudouridine-5'-phosphate glycosidase [Pisciglobus halotolerans]
MNKLLSINPEVADALKEGKAVVALESTIISHGMPYPQNVEMARKTEGIIREKGAVPATIAIIDGKIQVGLNKEQLELLATAEDVAKVSRRDLAQVLATKKIGATTVASTMIASELAGIKVFVTGGIGGVHRGYEEHMDVSADLEELSHTPVTVVAAGAKAILDLPRTLEYLETKGVPVLGYRTDYLPAFFSSTSEHKLNARVDSAEEVADIMKSTDALEFNGGILVANPIPKEDEIPAEEINEIIEEAIKQEQTAGIRGKDSTPFLLSKIVELTDGKSLDANLALVYHNAEVGAKIAVEYME